MWTITKAKHSTKKYLSDGKMCLTPSPSINDFNLECIKNLLNFEWIPCSDQSRWPEIGVEVVIYYRLKQTTGIGKKAVWNGEYYHYQEFAKLESITEREGHVKYPEWIGKEYQGVEPEFWRPKFPNPVIEEQKA